MKFDKIIIHHSLTKDSTTVSWGAIRRYHTETLGWSDIGYHAGIELVGNGPTVYYEVLLGRIWDNWGAHTKGHNRNSLGFCFVGNYDEVEPSDEMLITGAKLIKMWLRLFGIKSSEIYGHRDFADKSCPGLLFDMDKLRSLARE